MSSLRTMLSSARARLVAHEKHLVVSLMTVIAVAAGFFFGFYTGAAQREGPLTTIVRAGALPVTDNGAGKEHTAAAQLTARDCLFVGSAKGTKYYPPTCTYAKNIAKENLRCFTSEKQAQEEGYTRSQSC